jgi:hypothetical protein
MQPPRGAPHTETIVHEQRMRSTNHALATTMMVG